MAYERLAEAHPIIQKVFSNMILKSWIGVAFAVLFDVSKGPELTAVLILIMIDFLTGVGASKYKGEQIKSAKIFRSAVKVITYFAVISAGFLLETSIGYNVGADEILIAFFGATEFISIMENMAKLGFKTPRRLLNIVEDIQNGKAKKK
jgi:toxin secretion/phage lysis holin